MSGRRSSLRENSEIGFEPLESRRLLAASPVLVGDINKTTDMLNPDRPVQSGKFAYFAGRPVVGDGRELFRTDGTKTGTTLVKNINPVTGSEPQDLVDNAGKLYFTATADATGVRDIYTSDGTAASTVRATNFAATNPYASPGNLTVVGRLVYFTATAQGELAPTLWRTDGTAAGTRPVTFGGTAAKVYRPTNLTVVSGQLYLSASASTDYNTAAALYRVSDGVLRSVPTAPAGVSTIAAFNGAAYFSVSNNDAGFGNGDLWRTDGTTTTRVKAIDFPNGSYDSAGVRSMVASGDRLYFEVTGDPKSATTLWRTDGTTAGTFALTTSGTVRSTPVAVGVHSVLYVDTAAVTGQEFYVSDGTVAGTKLLKDTAPGTANGAYAFGGLVRLASGKSLFTTSSDFGAPTQVWTTDGTPANTKLVTKLTDIPIATAAWGTVNGVALLQSVGNAGQGDLYRSDGTTGGTYRIGANVAANASSLARIGVGSSPEFVAVGNAVYFTATDGKSGYELYKSVNNATPVRVADLFPGGGPSTPALLTPAADGALYFEAFTTSTRGRDIFRIPPGGGSPQKIIANGAADGIRSYYQFAVVGNVLYFTGVPTGTSTGEELWRYDPAVGKPERVLTVERAAEFTPFVRAGANWYFGVVRSVANGTSTTYTQQLYRLAASATATPQLVTEIVAGSYYGELSLVGSSGSTVYFTAYTATAGAELYKSDGTAAGTKRVADLSPGTASTYLPAPAPGTTLGVNGLFYFGVTGTSSNIYRPYVTDGTAAGTGVIDGVDSGKDFVTVGGRVYFIGVSGTTTSVYRVDGRKATRVTFGASGDNAFTPTGLTVVGSRVFVVGTGGANARYELWQADAAFGGFAKVTTLAPVFAYSALNGLSNFRQPKLILTATATDLYFPMYTAATGLEPYRLPLGSPTAAGSISGTVFNDANRNGKFDGGDGLGNNVTVFLDSDNDGLLDSNETRVVTASDGKFAFTNLTAGTYRVRRVFGSGQSLSTAKADVTLTSGQAKTGVLIGTKKT